MGYEDIWCPIIRQDKENTDQTKTLKHFLVYKGYRTKNKMNISWLYWQDKLLWRPQPHIDTIQQITFKLKSNQKRKPCPTKKMLSKLHTLIPKVEAIISGFTSCKSNKIIDWKSQNIVLVKVKHCRSKLATCILIKYMHYHFKDKGQPCI